MTTARPAEQMDRDTGSEKSSSRSRSPSALATTETVVEVDPAMSSTATESDEPPDTNHGLQDQSVRLPFHRLLVIYFGIGVALFVSFLDQTSVSTAAPVIGGDIGGSERSVA